MGQKGKLLERFVLGADLPGEHMPGVPVVEISGENRVLIENHRGVTAYDSCQICVGMRYGTLCVNGSNLRLACMTRHQLVIVGSIECVSIRKGRLR